MDWQPIETYDALKKKPPLAVFWFEATQPNRPGGHHLYAIANLSRVMGSRICTHWTPLPDPPEVK